MSFFLNVLISSLVVGLTSWLAGQKPALAGFIVSLPLISILSILLSYAQYRDMERINQFAVSILVAVPLSLTFFAPFVLNKWLRMGFPPTFTLALALLAGAYAVHHFIFKSS